MHELIPLHILERGQTAEVGQLMGLPEQVLRLEELGLRQGAVVEMVDPGVPCIVRVAGSKLCFRNGDLLSVLVRPGAVA